MSPVIAKDVAASRAAQGLPEKVADPSVLARIASIVAQALGAKK